jgi:protein involved in polysaccharide export with SLBB domain
MMRFRKIVAATLVFSVFISSGVFAEVSLPANIPPEYQKYLDTPQGKKALEQYQAAQKSEPAQKSETAAPQPVAGTPKYTKEQVSVVEQNFSAAAGAQGFSSIQLFGYDVFRQTAGSFVPSADTPVPSNYVIGPGDAFTITLWGISEGIFKVSVDAEGNIVLPKVGVVSVAGLRYSELKPYIQQQLGRYYESISVNVAMSQIKSIRVYVVGDVVQPGAYTISSLSTLYGALFQSGGPSRQGSLRNIKLIRGNQTIATVDLYKFLLYGDKSQDRELLSGDTIFVSPIGDVVGIVGSVKRQAIYEIKGKADLIDILKLSGGFTPLSNLSRVQLERTVAHQRRIIIDRSVSTSTERANIMVQNMDLIKVYPIYAEIQNVVHLEGPVKQSGGYEWVSNMKLKDLVHSDNDLLPTAYLESAELIRFIPPVLTPEVISINFEKLFAGDESQNVALQPGDRIVVQSDTRPRVTVTLAGEFKLPGTYVIRDGERLSSVIRRAGGFTEDAYLFGAVFIRQSARQDQSSGSARFMREFERQLQEEEYRLSISDLSDEKIGKNRDAILRSRVLLDQLSNILIPGRVVIELSGLDEFTGSRYDVVAENGDTLSVPTRSNVVSILGEVYNPNSFLFEASTTPAYYINKVGGKTPLADPNNLFIIRADGSVLSRNSAWRAHLESGDVVVMPPELRLVSASWWDGFWVGFKDFMNVAYQGALAFAVVATYLKQ